MIDAAGPRFIQLESEQNTDLEVDVVSVKSRCLPIPNEFFTAKSSEGAIVGPDGVAPILPRRTLVWWNYRPNHAENDFDAISRILAADRIDYVALTTLGGFTQVIRDRDYGFVLIIGNDFPLEGEALRVYYSTIVRGIPVELISWYGKTDEEAVELIEYFIEQAFEEQ